MYLELPTLEAIERNHEEAVKRGCSGTTLEWWACTQVDDNIYLHVLDGDGLTPEELAECVDTLPPLPQPTL